jgi:hypothetical protein
VGEAGSCDSYRHKTGPQSDQLVRTLVLQKEVDEFRDLNGFTSNCL